MRATWNGEVIAESDDLEVGGQVNENAVWYDAEPRRAAAAITGRVAFWKGVEVTS